MTASEKPSRLGIFRLEPTPSNVERGVKTLGTRGVLNRASAEGLLNLPEAMEALLRTNFRLSRGLVQRVLEEDAKRKQRP